MISVSFLGSAIPSELGFSIPAVVHTPYPAMDGLPEVKQYIRIDSGNITVRSDLEEYKVKYGSLLLGRALADVHSLVDLVVFRDARVVTPILDKFIGPDGKSEPVAYYEERLHGKCTAYGQEPHSLAEVHKICGRNWRLRSALRDLIDAIRYPDIGVVNCGRALETLRNHFVSSSGLSLKTDPGRKAAWLAFNTALNLDPQYTKVVTDSSIDPRHGDKEGVDTATLHRSTELAWVILNRFIELQKRGTPQLRHDKFPILKP